MHRTKGFIKTKIIIIVTEILLQIIALQYYHDYRHICFMK
jgi:hypothetical protein